jgi:GT2 family glycosyltransferase
VGALFEQASSFVNAWRKPQLIGGQRWSISLIVPVYRPYHLREFLRHIVVVADGTQIVVVDDSGDNVEQLMLLVEPHLDVVLLRHAANLGRPTARNTGAASATGELLIFVDQDMFLSPGFVDEAWATLLANDGHGVVLGMRTTRRLAEIPTAHQWEVPDTEGDWRHSVAVAEDLIDLTASGVGSAQNRCRPGQRIRLHDETRGFRDLGVMPEATLGYWDLASMVVSHSMAITADDFWRLGGFPEWIHGWGGEDTVLGFSAAAARLPIIPSQSVSYQAQHPPYSGSDRAKRHELARNMRLYRHWAQTADTFPSPDITGKRERSQQLR